MPILLAFIGVIMMVAAVRGTTKELSTLVKGDFTGPNNFLFWTLAIILIGAVGYYRPIKPLSTAFIVLVIIVLVLQRGGGLFDRFTEALNMTQKTTAADASGTSPLVPGTGFHLPTLPNINLFGSLGGN